MADVLKSYANDISFLSSQSSAFVQGIVITSAHMAKGLEFDEVIIPQTDERNYRSEIDKSMLYVAVTRAMHRLTLTFHEARPATHWWWIIKEIYPNSLVQDAASNGVSHQ